MLYNVTDLSKTDGVTTAAKYKVYWNVPEIIQWRTPLQCGIIIEASVNR